MKLSDLEEASVWKPKEVEEPSRRMKTISEAFTSTPGFYSIHKDLTRLHLKCTSDAEGSRT